MNYIQQFRFQHSIYHLNYSAPFVKRNIKQPPQSTNHIITIFSYKAGKCSKTLKTTLMNYIQQFPFQHSIYHLNYSAPFVKRNIKQSPQSLHFLFLFLLNIKESKNHTLKKTVGVWVSNLRADNDLKSAFNPV